MKHAQAVVAAGSPGTARVAAEILARGGNAVDAACAACLATSAHEPVLTSLAGGGVMLVHDAASGQAHIIDFFSNAPGLGRAEDGGRDFEPVTVDFGGAKQVFHVGRAAAAVPGTLPGLAIAHQRFGRLPVEELIEPACTALRRGVVLDAFQASTFGLLHPILTRSEGTRAIYAPGGRQLQAGDRFANPALADTLQAMARVGLARFVEQELGPLLLRDFGVAAGGGLTAEDLRHYQVRVLEPRRGRYRGVDIATHAWPSHGGTLMLTMLSLLEAIDLPALGRASDAFLAALVAAQRTASAVKSAGRDPLAGDGLEAWRAHFEALRTGAAVPSTRDLTGPGHTTHISVIDAQGNAAAVTISYGEGCGHMLGDTGIVLNNFMGEDDLHPAGFFTVEAGTRLQTNMCPTRVIAGDRLMVLGSGGANRIRTAIAQVLLNLIDFGMSPAEAVNAGRLHVEDGVVNAEVFDLSEAVTRLDALAAGDQVLCFERPSMFFGGVHLALRHADGRVEGAGDPRRSGHVEIVECP
ncbi:MAG: gamma-glutamyltransferase [Pseudomonadota bacterium]